MVKNLTENCNQLKAEIRELRSQGDTRANNDRSNMANLTQRLNILELTRSRAPTVLQADNNIHDRTEQPTPSKNQTSAVNKKREDISSANAIYIYEIIAIISET